MFDYQITMDSLPIIQKINRTIFSDVSVERIRYFCLYLIISRLLRLKAKSVGSEQKLYEKGEIGRELYTKNGKSKLTYDGDDTLSPNKYRILKRGDVCGKSILTGKECTVACLSWSEFGVLDINDIIDVLKVNYDINEREKNG